MKETGIVSYEVGRERELDKRVGQRVRALRLRRGLGAAACAELCGRSAEWLRQVERGEQPLDKLSTVVLLARVLGVVDLGLIVGEKLGGLTFTSSPEGRPMHEAVPAVRRTLSAPTLPGQPRPDLHAEVAAVRQRIVQAWMAWRGSRQPYTALGVIVPDLLRDTVDLHRANTGSDRRETWVLLSEVFQMAQRFLYCVGEPELAVRAADRAMVAAEEADNALLLGISAWTSSMSALAGRRFDEASDIAQAAADLLRPQSRRSTKALSVRGSLQLFAAIAYARSGRPADAWRSWDEAEEASRLLGPAHHNDLTMFGEANVGIYAVAIDIETGKASSGLSKARKVDDAAIPSTNRRAQHRLDVARGHWTRSDHDGVLAALCDSEHESTETIFYSAVARELVLDLLNASRRKPDPRLLALGKRIRVL